MSTYRNRPVFDFRPSYENVGLAQLEDFTFESVGAGVALPWKITPGPKRSIHLNFKTETKQEINTLRQFIDDRGGRREGFWLPVWANDYALVADPTAGATTLSISPIGIAKKTTFGKQFKHLALIDPSTMEYHGISNVSGTDPEVLSLDTTVTNNFSRAQTICCGLMYVRFSGDKFVFEYEHEEYAVLGCDFTELPPETQNPVGGAAVTVHLGTKPIALYRIVRAGVTYRWANYGVDVTTTDSLVWLAASIANDDLVFGVDFLSEDAKVTISTDQSSHPFRQFLDRFSLYDTTLEIFETDASTLIVDLTKPVHTGRVKSVEFQDGGRIHVTVGSILRYSEKSCPAIRVQRTCNHRTYDPNCGLNAATYTTTGTILTIQNTSPPYVEAQAFEDKVNVQNDVNWFALGKVTVGTEIRLCTGTGGSANKKRLYLNAAFRNAIVGNSVSALAGDDKRIGTCQGKFNNLANFLGMPYLPNRNPQFESMTTPKPQGGKKN